MRDAFPDSSGRPHAGLPGVDLAGTVVVQLADRAPTKAGDHRLLVGLVSRLTGVDAGAITLDQVCPSCGKTGHGPLRVVVGGTVRTARAVHVSLARAGGRLALAVTAAGPVGVDLESVVALRRAPVADVLLSGAEARALAALDPPAAAAAVAAVWTAKEAVLKAAGVGLRVDPRDLTIAPAGAGAPATGRSGRRDADQVASRPVLAGWPAAPFPLDQMHLLPLAASAGTVGTVAVVCAAPPVLALLPVQAG